MVNFYLALVSVVVYFIIKFFEQRIIKKEQPNMKFLFRDSMLVGFSILLGEFVYNQFAPLTSITAKQPMVFVNDPDF